MTEFQAAVLTEQFKRFKEHDKSRQKNGKYLEQKLTQIPGLTPKKRYNKNTRFTYVTFELDYDRKHFKDVPAEKFAQALRAEGIPVTGGKRTYSGGCHKEGMLEEHLSSRAYAASFSKARLEKYRQSLRFPVMDNTPPTDRERLSMDSKIMFLAPRKDMDGILEAFEKVAKNADKLT
jgi:dTDP-4-amino-4,6-dideoxygalactose transaminase